MKVKRVADPIRNTRTFESSVLAGVLNVAVSAAEAGGLSQNALLGTTRAVAGACDTFASSRLACSGLEIAVGDVVVFGNDCGIVEACLAAGGELHVLVRRLVAVDGLWRHTADRERRLAAAVQVAVAWKVVDDVTIRILHR